MEHEYYGLEDVMKKLHKSKSTVLREAKAGLIPSELEKGKLKGRRYPKSAIDVLAELDSEKIAKKKKPHFEFSLSTPSDLWAELMLRQKLFGEKDVVSSYKRLMQWRISNEEIFASIKEDGQLVAFSSLVPLGEVIIRELIEGKITEIDIPLSAIKQWTEPQLSVYIVSFVAQPDSDKEKTRYRGMQLIRNTVKWALDIHNQYNIKDWYTISADKEGQKLLKRLGFTEIGGASDGEKKGYYLKDSAKPTRFVSMFLKEAER